MLNPLLDRVVRNEVAIQRRTKRAGGGQHPRVFARAVVEDGQRLAQLVPDVGGGRLVIGPVGAALQGALGDAAPLQQIAHHLDVSRLAVVRRRHDGKVFGFQVKPRGDPRFEGCEGLERLGAGAEVGQTLWVSGARMDPSARIRGDQMTDMKRLFDAAPLDAHHRDGGVEHAV